MKSKLFRTYMVVGILVLLAALITQGVYTAQPEGSSWVEGNRPVEASIPPQAQDFATEAAEVPFGGPAAVYSYDAAGRLIKVEYSTGTTITYTYDAAGNMLRREIFGTLFNVTITTPESRTYSNTCVRLNFTVEPEGTALDWIGYSLDGGANVTIAGNTTVGGLSEGGHSIVVYANDTWGNMAASNIVFFTIHPGDIDFGGKVWIGDVFLLRAAYGSHLGEDNWNANADLDCNSHVWIADVFILRGNYGNEYQQ